MPLPRAEGTLLRIATYNTELSAKGPGLLLRTLRAEPLAGRAAWVVSELARVDPDIAVLQGIDFDHDGRALAALARRLEEAGAPYPYRFALRPNAGMCKRFLARTFPILT
ncbi:hypothetical protein [Profundibacterium mesophilum]|nr:hypothetical protein [Profundibacterium mesophilum]